MPWRWGSTSTFATTARLVLAQEAVPDKANELAAIPPLLERLGAEDGLKGALVSIDAIATNADVAAAITAQGADYLLAVKANQPTLRAEVEAAFAEAGDPRDPRRPRQGPRPHRGAPHRPCSARPTGSTARAASRASCACPAPPASSAPRPASRAAAPPAPRPATSSPPAPSPPPTPPRRSASTGRSRTACTGCSTSPSPTTSPASARATAPATWPPSATSPSTSSAPPPTSDPSSPDRKIAGWDPDYLDAILSSRPA